MNDKSRFIIELKESFKKGLAQADLFLKNPSWDPGRKYCITDYQLSEAGDVSVIPIMDYTKREGLPLNRDDWNAIEQYSVIYVVRGERRIIAYRVHQESFLWYYFLTYAFGWSIVNPGDDLYYNDDGIFFPASEEGVDICMGDDDHLIKCAKANYFTIAALTGIQLGRFNRFLQKRRINQVLDIENNPHKAYRAIEVLGKKAKGFL